MKILKNHWPKVATLIFAAIILLWKGCEVTQKEPITIVPAPKIIEIEKPFVKPVIKENVVPKIEKKYKKKDTTLRKEAEKKDIILDVKIEDGMLKEDIISDSGQVKEVDVPVPVKVDEGAKEVLVDQEGKVEVKEKTKAGKLLQKIGRGTKHVLIVTGGVAIVAVTAIAGAPVIAVVSVGVVTAVVVIAAIKSDH